MNNYSYDQQLAKSSISLEFNAEQTIFSYGEQAEKVYLILEGIVRLFVKTEGGEEEIARLKSGDILGETALLEKKQRASRAETAQETSLLAFAPEDLKAIMEHEPILNENIITTLCNRILWLQKQEVELPPITQELQPQENNKQESQQTKPKTKEEDNSESKHNSIPKQESTNFYLPNHKKNYNITANSTFEKYTYTKEINCPICSNKIKVKKVRNSKLRLKTIRDDLRPIYKKFKPAWYKVWSCPHCFYTARKTDFFAFSSRQKNKIKNNFKKQIQTELGPTYQPGYSKPRTINEVFAAYYLAIKLYNLIDVSKDKLGYLWLRLNWLYEDVEAEELSHKSSYKAMNHLQEFYFNSGEAQLPRPQEDKLTLLLALLLAEHQKTEKALPLLDNLIRSPQTNPRQKQLARDKFMELRRKKKEQSETAN